MARCCNDFSRTDLLRRAAAKPAAGCRRSRAGMPLPAGTGLDRRSFLARTRRARAGRLRRPAFLPRAFEEGIAAARRPARSKVLVSVFLDGGADSLSLLFPDGDPLYRKLRPTPGAADVGRPSVQRGPAAPLAPVAGAGWRSCTERARSR